MIDFRFAPLLSWWLLAALAVAAGVSLVLAYRRPVVRLSRPRLFTLFVLRAVAVETLLVFLMRPVARVPASASQAVVPILVDVSRSMRIADAGGLSRLDRARAIAQYDLVPALSQKYQTPVVDAGDGNASDLTGALAAVRDRFRGQRVAGVVLVSDGADTGTTVEAEQPPLPVFAIGVGSTSGLRDREILAVAAGDPHLTDASVDLDVSASSAGFGRAPYEIRLLANGSALATKRVTPSADGSPDHVRFTVAPDTTMPTVYRAEIPSAPGELVLENNAQSVLVNAAGRKRRVLVIAGAPGFEHSFMMRAWAADSGLDVDSVVRKGRNADGRDTFVIQAATDRTQALSGGFPQRREDLYAYDALVFANVEGDAFTRAQLAMAAEFVSERGGGLLVAGGVSLSRPSPQGLAGSPLEPVLPVELDARRAGPVRTEGGAASVDGRSRPNQLVVTADGATHPIMRLGASGDETRAQWAALPALASLTPLGQARPGASVLAVASSLQGGVFPVVAVQKYGRGRAMIFGGDASWRWRMLAASTDRSHELFWRQAARWLSTAAADPVSIVAPESLQPGDAASLDIAALDASFAAVADARVTATVALEGGAAQPLATRKVATPGHVAAAFEPKTAGLYRFHVEAARGNTAIGTADRTVYVGGHDREFADPRLNEGFLRRLARESGGRYVPASDAARIVPLIDDSARQRAEPEQRDLWQRPWTFALVIALLCVEWTLRRRWGLR